MSNFRLQITLSQGGHRAQVAPKSRRRSPLVASRIEHSWHRWIEFKCLRMPLDLNRRPVRWSTVSPVSLSTELEIMCRN